MKIHGQSCFTALKSLVVTKLEEMQMIANIAKKYNSYVIGDEVYREFIYNNQPLQSLAKTKNADENIVIIDSVSKRFSACGARIGAPSHNKELIAQCLKLCQARLSVATFDQVASAKLYSVGSDYFESVRKEYKHRRDICYKAIKKIPGVICSEPQGAFYMMAALPVDSADNFQKWLLSDFEDRSETVMFAPGEGFYATPGKGKNEIRIAYVLKQSDLERAMELLALGIERYNTRPICKNK